MPVMMSVSELQPGMRLYRALYRDSAVLLPAGKMLSRSDIDTLRQCYENVRLLVCDPILDELVDFDDAPHDPGVTAQVRRRLGKLLTLVRERLAARTPIGGAEFAELQRRIAEMVDFMRDNPVTTALLLSSAEWSDHLQQHPAGVFYLSLLTGSTIQHHLSLERRNMPLESQLHLGASTDLVPLGVGALFHDIGMIALERLYAKDTPLTDAEWQLIREHPLSGEAMLPKELNELTRMVVRTHHENHDGSGYPQGLDGKDLHVFSRIIRVADSYDAATNPRAYRQAKSAARVLWEMMTGSHAVYYDPVVLKLFSSLVQPFPIGAKVRLNCGRFGVVVRHNRRHPFRPTIVIAFNENGRKLPKSKLIGPMDLAACPDVQFVQFGSERLEYLAAGLPAESVAIETEVSNAVDDHQP